jgi:hypothetical protein
MGLAVRRPLARATTWRVVAAAVALLAAALARPSGATGDAPAIHESLREFLPTSKYEFVGEPRLERATQVYLSARSAAYLVRGTALGSPLLVRTGAGVLESVPEDALIDRPDGGFDLRADVKPKELGRFQLKGRDLLIDVPLEKDKPDVPLVKGKLSPPAPLLGWQKAANLLAHSPEYERDAKAYVVVADCLTAIKAVKGRINVFVYFGSWCPTCSTVMGKVLRVEKDLTKDLKEPKEGEGPAIQFDYYGLPPEPDTWEDKESKGREIFKIPTGLVYIDSHLAGRIEPDEWSRPEAALRRALESK